MRLQTGMVRQAQHGDDPWRVSNQVLYDLCARYPRHVNDAEIVAKLLLIGRAYSASLERGRGDAVGPGVTNDTFYTEHATRVLRESDLDMKLKALKKWKSIDAASVRSVLDIHQYLVTLFEKLTDKGKRSLASKYLHFHRPDLFFILDSRAVEGMRRLGAPRTRIDVAREADPAYAKFVGAALGLREVVAAKFKTTLTPRELDRLLLAAASARA